MQKKKPLIGVTTSANKGYSMWWFIRLGVQMMGGKAIRISAIQNSNNFKCCDAYIISGGVDIDPQNYKQDNIASQDIEPDRDVLEQKVIKHALKNDKALMGICRGAQMINIVKGGNLYQKAGDFYEGFMPSENVISKAVLRRKIKITEDGILMKIFKHRPTLWVNSIHRQAINELGEGLKIVGLDKYGIVQAIECNDVKKNNFILGMQWHPEFMLYSRAHRKIFKSFLDYTKDRLS